MSRIIALGWAAALAVALIATDLRRRSHTQKESSTSSRSSPVPAPAGATSKAEPVPRLQRSHQGAEKIDGLFTLYKKGDHLYAEIRPDQFDQPLLVPITIARGMAAAGIPVGDEMGADLPAGRRRIQLIRRNIHYKASAARRSRRRSSRTTPTRC